MILFEYKKVVQTFEKWHRHSRQSTESGRTPTKGLCGKRSDTPCGHPIIEEVKSKTICRQRRLPPCRGNRRSALSWAMIWSRARSPCAAWEAWRATNCSTGKLRAKVPDRCTFSGLAIPRTSARRSRVALWAQGPVGAETVSALLRACGNATKSPISLTH
jgi:hypothetical protein